MSESARAPRAARLAPFVAALAVGATALATVSADKVGVFWDDGIYLITARALAAGEGYRFIHLPGAPPAVHFPPGWPALLALVLSVLPGFPAAVPWLKLLNPLLLAFSAALACVFGMRRLALPPWAAAVGAVLFAAALPVLITANVLFSEPCFLTMLFATLLVAERTRAEGGWPLALAAGLAAGALTLVRAVGVAAVPAITLALLIDRRRVEAVVATASAVAVVTPWQLWVAAHAGGLPRPLHDSYGPYLEWVRELYIAHGGGYALVMLRNHVESLLRTAAVVFFPFGPHAIRPLLVVLLIVTAATGGYRALRRAPTAVFFLAGYAPMVLLWPYAPDRFAWAVWPLVGLLIVAGAFECWRLGAAPGAGRGVRATVALVTAVAAWGIAGHAGYTVRGIRRHWWDIAQRRNTGALQPVVDWVNAHTRPDDVVACVGEPLVYLYTGRRVSPVHELSPEDYLAGTPMFKAAADMRALFAVNKPRWAVFAGGAPEIAAAALLDGAGGTVRLVRVDTLPGGGIAFRVERP